MLVECCYFYSCISLCVCAHTTMYNNIPPPEKIHEEILTTSLFHRLTPIFSNPQMIFSKMIFSNFL